MSVLHPDELNSVIHQLVQEFAEDTVRGTFLTGSYARDAADAWSDIDLVCITQEGTPHREELVYRAGRLVSIAYITLSHWRSVLSDPDSALHAIAPFRAIRPLLDQDGAVRELHEQATALDISGDVFQKQAGRRAASLIHHQAEVVHKVMGGLELHDELRVLASTLELVQGMTRAATLLHTLPVTSGNTHLAQILATVGPESAWSQAFRQAVGLTTASIWIRGQAAVKLFLETAAFASPHFTEDEQGVIDQLGEAVENRLG